MTYQTFVRICVLNTEKVCSTSVISQTLLQARLNRNPKMTYKWTHTTYERQFHNSTLCSTVSQESVFAPAE